MKETGCRKPPVRHTCDRRKKKGVDWSQPFTRLISFGCWCLICIYLVTFVRTYPQVGPHTRFSEVRTESRASWNHDFLILSNNQPLVHQHLEFLTSFLYVFVDWLLAKVAKIARPCWRWVIAIPRRTGDGQNTIHGDSWVFLIGIYTSKT